MTILLVEHDMEAVFALADRITVLVYGRVIATGPPEEIRANAEGARGLSRRAGRGGAQWLTLCCEIVRHRNLLRPQSGAVRPVAAIDCIGRNGHADGPQRHGQDHDGALDHGADAGTRAARSASAARRFAGSRPYRVAKLGVGLGAGRPSDLSRTSPCAKIWSRPRPIHPAQATRGRYDKVIELFPRLAERAGSMGNLLSGGEQQMLAIGRALMTNPNLLILDEATEGLAPLIRAGNLAMPHALEEGGTIDPGDRQECRRADRDRRPPLHDRARPHGVERHVEETRRRAGYPAPLSGVKIFECPFVSANGGATLF